MAMTAHIKYLCLDENDPVSCSKACIDYIRENINYNNILISDDIAMKALSGTYAEKTKQVLASGCDIVLHCTGNIDEMQEIMPNVGEMDKEQTKKFAGMQKLIKSKYNQLDYEACKRELQSLLQFAPNLS
jgi:beta-N-acetylhexosaminidase